MHSDIKEARRVVEDYQTCSIRYWGLALIPRVALQGGTCDDMRCAVLQRYREEGTRRPLNQDPRCTELNVT